MSSSPLTCQSHGECAQKQALARVVDHGGPYLGVQDITGHGKGQEDEKEDDVEGEEAVGQIRERRGCVRKPAQKQDGHNASAHVHGKPGGREVADDASPPYIVFVGTGRSRSRSRSMKLVHLVVGLLGCLGCCFGGVAAR